MFEKVGGKDLCSLLVIPVALFVCLSTYVSVYVHTYVHMCLPTYLSIYLMLGVEPMVMHLLGKCSIAELYL